jgi:hypothetical protein
VYGVPRHPLFFIESYIKAISKDVHKFIFGDEEHLASYKDENELADEDEDCKAERKMVYGIKKDLYN